MHFLACGALEAEVDFFAGFSSGHAPFGDGWLGVFAHVADAHVPAGFNAFFAAPAEGVRAASGFLFAFDDFVFVVLFARWAVLFSCFGQFHERLGSGPV